MEIDYFKHIYLGEINMNEIKQTNVLINLYIYIYIYIFAVISLFGIKKLCFMSKLSALLG